MRTVLLIAVLALGLAARAPWLLREPQDTERAHAGAARHLVLQHDRDYAPLTLDPPLASHVGSPVLWTLRAPAPEIDDAGPSDQIGWLALLDTKLPTGEAVAPSLVAAGMRLPFVLLQLVGLWVLFRFAERFYGTATGLLSAGTAAVAAGPALVGATATPAALALPVTALLVAALDDMVRAVGYSGPPPPWLLRKRTLALGFAAGLALAASHVFLPIVLVGAAWLAGRRDVIARRGDDVQPPAFSRRIAGVLVAFLVLWALHGGDLGRYEEADLMLPAPLWWEGVVRAARDAVATPWTERAEVLGGLQAPGFLAVAALAVIGWPFLRRDRTDVPALLLTVAVAAVGTALVAAPRHAAPALAAALPPLTVLAAAWLVRLARHARVVAAAAGALLLVGIAAGWHAAAPWSPAPAEERGAEPARLTADENWLLRRWIVSRAPQRVLTILGREPKLRLTETTRVDEVSVTDPRVAATLREIEQGADVALVVGDWVPSVPRSISDREPDARFLRLAIHGRR